MTNDIVPLDSSCEAEYEDGFVLSETEQNDQSAYIKMEMVEMEGELVVSGPNTLNDIVEKRPEAEHGKMVRFSVYYHNARYDVDWTKLPENSRPIRLRDRSNYLVNESGEIGVTDWHGCRMGYQFTDANGKNQQFIDELE